MGALVINGRDRRRMLAATVAGGLVAYGTAALTPRNYQAHAVLLTGPISSNIDTLLAAGKLALTYGQLATSPHVLAETERKLHLPGAGGRVRVKASDGTRLITIHATDRDPAVAAQIANADARTLLEVVAQRHPRPGGPGRLELVDAARPGSPQAGPWLFGLLGAVAGLLGALGLAVLLDRPGGPVTSIDELRTLTGCSVLGELGGWRRLRRRYRLLAAKLTALGPRSVLLVCMENEGAAVATRLASALGAGGTRVAVLDADEAEPLSGDAGGHQHAVDRARQRLTQLVGDADVVLAYARPPSRSATGLAWARAADATVLVARRDRTPGDAIRAALESLELVGARTIGSVLTSAGRRHAEVIP